MIAKYLIANWKMQLDQDQAFRQATELKNLLNKEKINKDLNIILCPDFISLASVAEIIKDSKIVLGAQDVFYEKKGAYTGEVSITSLKKLACEYVIVGHSERRALGESDEMVNKKAKAVLENNLIPIICVGETLAEYKAGLSKKVLTRQVSKALKNLSNKFFILAYEPIWSISTSGSGKVISPAEAIAQIEILKKSIPAHFNNFDIIYGGSVSAQNIQDFISSPNIRGALVGNASLVAKEFFSIIKKIHPVK